MSQLDILARMFVPISLPVNGVEAHHAPRLSGVYLLVNRQSIIYVGKSTHLSERLHSHIAYQHPEWVFDRVLWLDVPRRHLREYESTLIRALRPEHNWMATTYRGHDNGILKSLGLGIHPEGTDVQSEWEQYIWARRLRERGDSYGRSASGATR